MVESFMLFNCRTKRDEQLRPLGNESMVGCTCSGEIDLDRKVKAKLERNILQG